MNSRLNSAFRSVKRLLGFSAGASRTREPAGRAAKYGDREGIAPKSTAGGSATSLRKIERDLARVLSSGGTAVAGRVQVLNFDALRQALGDKWDEFGDRIRSVIERALSRHLASSDMSTRYGDHAYLLVFTSLTPAEAQIKCALIRKYVEDYFREVPEVAGNIEISTAVTTVDGDVHLEKPGDMEALFEKLHIQTVGESSASDSTPVDSELSPQESLAASKGSSIDGGVQAGDGIWDADDPSIAESTSADSPPWEPVQLAANSNEIHWQRMGADPDELPEYMRNLALSELPIWSVTRKTNVGTLFLAQSQMPQAVHTAGSCVGSAVESSITLPLDELVLEHLTRQEAEASEATRIYGAQVHFRSIATTNDRLRMQGALSKLSADQRDNRILEVVGVPPHVGAVSLEMVVQYLQSFARTVILCCDMHEPQFPGMRNTGDTLLGFVDSSQGPPNAATEEALLSFLKLAQNAKFSVCSRDLQSPEMVYATITYGAEMVIGDTHGVVS